MLSNLGLGQLVQWIEESSIFASNYLILVNKFQKLYAMTQEPYRLGTLLYGLSWF